MRQVQTGRALYLHAARGAPEPISGLLRLYADERRARTLARRNTIPVGKHRTTSDSWKPGSLSRGTGAATQPGTRRIFAPNLDNFSSIPS
jgi:hypothetical protein